MTLNSVSIGTTSTVRDMLSMAQYAIMFCLI